MTKTFKLVRVPIDSDNWLLVTDRNTVWGAVFCDFFSDSAMPELYEQITDKRTPIECILMSKAHYDTLMLQISEYEDRQ